MADSRRAKALVESARKMQESEELEESTRGLRTMKRSQAKELEKQGHTVKVYDRRGLVVVDGKDQYKLVEEAMKEVPDYRMSDRDKKVIQAFLDHQQYEGKVLETDGKVITSTSYVGGYSSTEPLAKWVKGPDGDRVLVSNETFGSISQTWVNYVRRQVPRKLLFEGRERWKSVGRVVEPKVSEPVQVEEPIVSPKKSSVSSVAQRMTEAPKKLDNPFVSVEYSDRNVSGDDKTDKNNYPCFFTRSRRGLERAWLELVKEFTPTMRMGQVMEFLQSRGISVHYYCAMD